MGIDSGAYQFVLVLHLVAVVIGFGTTFSAGFYGMEAKARKGREGAAIAEASLSVTTKVGEWAIYAVPILGIALVMMSDDAWKFSQVWISLSFLVYIAAIGLVHGMHLPNVRKMNQLMAELAAGEGGGASSGGPPPQVAELEARGKRAAMAGGLLNAMWVLAVVLMVAKPGL